MRKWRIEDSEELYNISSWGVNYFSINEKGNVIVTPRKDGVAVDMKELIDELQLRDVAAPVLVRFPDILDNRIEKISTCFKKAAKEYAESVKTYSDNLELATVTMLKGAGDAEDCGNLIKNVWYNAIYKEKDDETDKYTRPDGYFVSDFNDALGNLFVDSSFSSKIDSIDKNQDTVNSLMKKLKNPPEEYKDAYDALSDFYDAYLALTGCATDPSGSLQTYSSTFNDADTDTLNAYKAMQQYLGD